MIWLSRGFLVVVAVLALFADCIAGSEPIVSSSSWSLYPPIRATPYEVRFGGRIEVLREPSASHILGTDDRGRDVASRLVHGSRATAAVAIATAVLASLLAVFLGFLASLRSWLDRSVLGLCDALAAVPVLLMVLLVRGLVGGGIVALVVLISIPRAASTARLVRESMRHALSMPYCEAAHALGLHRFRVLWRHALPASFSQLKTAAGLTAGTAVLAEVALSFLGLGLSGQTPSWGGLLRAAHENQLAWWLLVPAGLFTTALAYCLTSQVGRHRGP